MEKIENVEKKICKPILSYVSMKDTKSQPKLEIIFDIFGICYTEAGQKAKLQKLDFAQNLSSFSSKIKKGENFRDFGIFPST